MKRVTILLAAVFAVASSQPSVASADDTLEIRSLRSIDVCGSEKSALIAIDLGEIYFSDSLMSFDITLSYDTTFLIPGNVLSNGTLSQQLSWMDGPFITAAIPGEIRLYGASILTPAKGKIPLVAVTADAKRLRCGVAMPIGLAYPADFNPEFKRSYNLWSGDTVRFIARQTMSAVHGVDLQVDEVETSGKDNVVAVPVRVTTKSRDNEHLMATFTASQPEGVVIDSVDLMGLPSIKRNNGTTVTVQLSGNDSVFIGLVFLRQVTKDSMTVLVQGTVESTACACTVPKQQDSVWVRTTVSPGTGIQERDIDVDPEIRLIGNDLTIQGGHEYPAVLKLYDLFGRMITDVRVERGDTTINLQELPPGPIFIVMTAGGRTKRMMQRN